MEYTVTIVYREPMYEVYAGAKAEPYTVSYPIEAESEADAKEKALDWFKTLEANSHVGWHRVVERVDIL
jgi:hypothetical protein